MQLAVLVVHLVICVALIGLVLLQRSEGGALGIGGGSGSLMSGRGAADTLARMTSFAGGAFLITSLALTLLSGSPATATHRSLFDLFPQQTQSPAPAPTQPAAPPPQQQPANQPDPIEGSVTPSTQLAAVEAPPPAITTTVAPAPTNATLHAAPAQTQPRAQNISTTTAAPLSPPPPTHTASNPGAPIATTHPQQTGAQTQQASVPAPARSNPPPAHTTTTTGAPLVGVPSLTNESSQSVTTATTTARRGAVGPDQ